MNLSMFDPGSSKLRLLLSLLVVLLSLLVMSVVSFLILLALGYSFSEFSGLASDFNNERSLFALKFLQLFQSLGLFVVPSIILFNVFKRPNSYFVCLNRKPLWIIVMVIFVIVIVSLPLSNYLAEWNAGIKLSGVFKNAEIWMKEKELSAEALTKAFLNVTNITGLFTNIIIMALIPAIGEEFLFRGVFQNIFTSLFNNVHIAIIFTGILFSSLHLQFYGFIPRMLLGVLFGYLFVWSGNIWYPVIAHFFNNAIIVIYYYINDQFQVGEGMEDIGKQTADWPVLLISLIVLSVMLWKFKEHQTKRAD